MSTLFSSYRLGPLQLPNRILVSPMCQYVADSGRATPWHVVHLGGLASSGAAAVFIESTAVVPEGRITPGDLGLWDDDTEAALGKAIEAMRIVAPKTKVILQLGHAGRKASSAEPWLGGQQLPASDRGWTAVAPSAVAQLEHETPPEALDKAGMQRVRDAFVASARRALRLGVDGIELHFAHGYLLHEFLSPISNQRGDEYGGSLENRMRYPIEVFKAIRDALPAEFPVGIKISATDWVDGGWDIDQSVVLGKELKEQGLAWITASSGGISPRQKIPVGPGYQVHLAEAIRQQTGVTTIAVGLITDAYQADKIIGSGQADFVTLARAMLFDPRWPWHAAVTLGASVEAAPSYWRAPPSQQAHVFSNTNYGAR
ncbi:NADH:flavin oxidoreductase/NADH oxidase [Herbaspirillum frisingense]|uniref:NADH:flavin oxidoreductase/NADH oxidase n=1 Tax=Herbaspirillum frisingense TaxID=92645 RepID=UPI001602BBB9|nr:NADH:flavin oxidoreductase/NADH oxidase [Herbaspirillum frisingense]QNB06722.1 NADH:flavin oxidoreductase/NADH oxidase [Herbaspirillum frisingense]